MSFGFLESTQKWDHAMCVWSIWLSIMFCNYKWHGLLFNDLVILYCVSRAVFLKFFPFSPISVYTTLNIQVYKTGIQFKHILSKQFMPLLAHCAYIYIVCLLTSYCTCNYFKYFYILTYSRIKSYLIFALFGYSSGKQLLTPLTPSLERLTQDSYKLGRANLGYSMRPPWSQKTYTNTSRQY